MTDTPGRTHRPAPVTAFLDGGSSEPEVEITVTPSEFAGCTFSQIDRPDWGTLAGLLLDEFQLGELIVALQQRSHIIASETE